MNQKEIEYLQNPLGPNGYLLNHAVTSYSALYYEWKMIQLCKNLPWNISALVTVILCSVLEAEWISVTLTLPWPVKHWAWSSWAPFEWLRSVIYMNRTKEHGVRGESWRHFFHKCCLLWSVFSCVVTSLPQQFCHISLPPWFWLSWTASSPVPAGSHMFPLHY